jgi:glycine hydroxymethyltransferase
MIAEVLDGLVSNGDSGNGQVEERIKREAIELCDRYPIYH